MTVLYEHRNALGQLHCVDGPAIETREGYKAYYRDGKRHRDDGPAIEWPDGYKEYYQNGLRHRDDGPAVKSAHHKAYYLNGKRVTKSDLPKRARATKTVTVSVPLSIFEGDLITLMTDLERALRDQGVRLRIEA